MSISMWQQIATIKASVLELTNVLIEEDPDDFTREQSVLDLIDIAKDLQHLEELAMFQVDKVDRPNAIDRADHRDSLRTTKNASAIGSSEGDVIIKAII